MNYQDYQTYLSSDNWKQKVQKRATIDNYKCCMCNSSGTMNNPLECHHITYRHIYNEDIYKDILTLYRNCHRSVHIMMNRVTSPDGRKGWKDEMSLSNHVLGIESEV